MCLWIVRYDMIGEFNVDDKLNRRVFKCFLKVGSVFAEYSHAGRLFQRRGAATPKARSPAVYSRDLRLTSLLNEAERSRQIVSQILRCCLVTALKHKNGQLRRLPPPRPYRSPHARTGIRGKVGL